MNFCYPRNIQRFTKGRIIAIPPFFRVPLLELPLLPYTTNVDGTVLISETKPSDSTRQKAFFPPLTSDAGSKCWVIIPHSLPGLT